MMEIQTRQFKSSFIIHKSKNIAYKMSQPMFKCERSRQEIETTVFNMELPGAPVNLKVTADITQRIIRRNGMPILKVAIQVYWNRYALRPQYILRPIHNNVDNHHINISEDHLDPNRSPIDIYTSSSAEEGESSMDEGKEQPVQLQQNN